jgi:hypothetical protein
MVGGRDSYALERAMWAALPDENVVARMEEIF